MRPRIEHPHRARLARLELILQELHNRGLARTPRAEQAHALATGRVLNQLSDRTGNTLMSAEGVFSGGCIRDEMSRAGV